MENICKVFYCHSLLQRSGTKANQSCHHIMPDNTFFTYLSFYSKIRLTLSNRLICIGFIFFIFQDTYAKDKRDITKALFILKRLQNKVNSTSWSYINFFEYDLTKILANLSQFEPISSDGSSPKKLIPGQSRALNIDLEPSPSSGPS